MKVQPQVHKEKEVLSLIVTVREQRVILGGDLAALYDVKTKVLNQAVRRHSERFPADFYFQLSKKETEEFFRSRSQNVTLKRGRNIKYLPYAFTEHGAIMAANVLNSLQAVKMSVFVVRAFIKMREQLAGQHEFKTRLAEIEKILLAHDGYIQDLYKKLQPLLLPPLSPAPKRIGFLIGEKKIKYGF